MITHHNIDVITRVVHIHLDKRNCDVGWCISEALLIIAHKGRVREGVIDASSAVPYLT